MPHVNYRRGETVTFVFRREHGRTTHATCCKGKRQSHKGWKNYLNSRHRAQEKRALRYWEDPFPMDRNVLVIDWLCC